MFGMDWAKISGLVRHLLTFGGGYFVAQGWVDEATATELVGAAMTLIGFVWSLRSKTVPAA